MVLQRVILFVVPYNQQIMDKEEKTLQKVEKNLSSLGYFDAELLEQALRIAEKFFKAGCFGGDVKSPEQAFVKIQAGAEMGMAPMEAMNSTYIVNGHIAIWGKALAKRLKVNGWEIEYTDCSDTKATVKIIKNGKSHEYTAKKEEVDKKQAYKIAPGNKLKYHALRQLINFYAPEVLGPISYTVEEIQSDPNIRSKVTVVDTSDGFTMEGLTEDIENIKDKDQYTEFTEKITGLKNVFTDEELKELIVAAKAKKDKLLEVGKKEVEKEESADAGPNEDKPKEEPEQTKI